MSMTITSSAFAQNGSIPKLYTCEGKDVSPPLAWSGAPANAKSLVADRGRSRCPRSCRAAHDLGALGGVQPAGQQHEACLRR